MQQAWPNYMSVSLHVADLTAFGMPRASDGCRIITQGDFRTLASGEKGSRNEVSAYGLERGCCKVLVWHNRLEERAP